jgi:lipoprotein-anchoring transpeptidase ErfK/SrfK
MKSFWLFCGYLTVSILSLNASAAFAQGLLNLGEPTLTIYVDKAPYYEDSNGRAISKTAQTMHVYHKNYDYPVMFSIVSTGRENSTETTGTGIETDSITPTGTFGITRMSIDHKSNLWDGAPMPYAIFFHQGFAIHGVYEGKYGDLGQRASGGCVRLALYQAEQLWGIIDEVGPENVRIVIYDSSTGVIPRQMH